MIRKRKYLRITLAVVLVFAVYLAHARFPRLLEEGLPQADAVVVRKSERTLYLLKDGVVYRAYGIALGAKPEGRKREEGDEHTPEGEYVLDWRNPNSKYHLSIHVSYPNEQDREHARVRGVSPGGMIMIHGQRNGFGWLGPVVQTMDWTNGCIAVTNADMEEIWRAVPDETPIRIEP